MLLQATKKGLLVRIQMEQVFSVEMGSDRPLHRQLEFGELEFSPNNFIFQISGGFCSDRVIFTVPDQLATNATQHRRQ